LVFSLFFFQAEDGIRDFHVTGVQTCALPISDSMRPESAATAATRRARLGWCLLGLHHPPIAASPPPRCAGCQTGAWPIPCPLRLRTGSQCRQTAAALRNAASCFAASAPARPISARQSPASRAWAACPPERGGTAG